MACTYINWNNSKRLYIEDKLRLRKSRIFYFFKLYGITIQVIYMRRILDRFGEQVLWLNAHECNAPNLKLMAPTDLICTLPMRYGQWVVDSRMWRSTYKMWDNRHQKPAILIFSPTLHLSKALATAGKFTLIHFIWFYILLAIEPRVKSMIGTTSFDLRGTVCQYTILEVSPKSYNRY